MTGPRQNVRMALFALSGNQCAFPGCFAPMFDAGTETILGEVCHIHAQSSGGPRYNGGLSAEELHGVGNLLLLCQAHHKIVDEHPNEYNAERLQLIKAAHEARAAATSPQILHRLIQALAPDVPDNWWERPGAPIFRTHLASSTPQDQPWTYEVTLEQIDGSDLGNLRYQWRYAEIDHEFKAPSMDKRPNQNRKWRLENFVFEPQSQPFELEIRFWWDGAERSVTYQWETEPRFHEPPGIRYA